LAPSSTSSRPSARQLHGVADPDVQASPSRLPTPDAQAEPGYLIATTAEQGPLTAATGESARAGGLRYLFSGRAPSGRRSRGLPVGDTCFGASRRCRQVETGATGLDRLAEALGGVAHRSCGAFAGSEPPNQELHLTRSAISVFQGSSSLRRPRQVSLCVRRWAFSPVTVRRLT
jgi:hypothetical protein